jgi:SanA protein
MASLFSRKGFAALGSLFALLLLFPFAANGLMRQAAAPYLYSSVALAPSEDEALVLGAAAYPSGPSDILRDRLDTALDLFRAGKVKKLILSGAPNEVVAMKAYVLAQGMKVDDLVGDPNGLNTLASIQPYSQKSDRLAIVSQDFHLPRALFIAHRLGVEAIGVSADRHAYPKLFDFERRELLASTKAILDLFWMK